MSRKVFVTHGHDHSARNEVALFLHEVGLTPIIMENQANEGRTLIEKFEKDSDAAYAIIIMSPDDLGRAKNSGDEKLQPRARQNVVFELGFFFGKSTRKRVAVLNTDAELERPTNIEGIAWILLDAHGGWKHMLTRELKAVGLVD